MTKLKVRHDTEKTLPSQLYIAIDHLNTGTYQLNITNNNIIVSHLKFEK